MTETDLPRLLVIMGSGETAPGMRRVHNDLLARMGSPDVLLLDTTYGFQPNREAMSEKLADFFRTSLGAGVVVADLPRLHGLDPAQLERGLERLRSARYVFAGPGSPTYALRQWQGTPVPGLLAGMLRSGGAVVFSSAATLTLGRLTMPVYEIYKVGEEPRWLPGLDLLAEVGIDAAVVPHWDNAEGGGHDTRRCFVGEAGLAALEAQLPAAAAILGVDEHTALILDLDTDRARVEGRGGVTVRRDGSETIFPSGSTMPIDALRGDAAKVGEGAAAARNVPPRGPDGTVEERLAAARSAFDAALAARRFGAAASSLLAAEALGTVAGDESARAQVRAMVVRLADAAEVGAAQDPREAIAPFVEALLAVRGAVRAERRYDLSDLIRDRLLAAGVEVRDTPDGATWQLAAMADAR